jgi:nucleoid DNA-binding protein
MKIGTYISELLFDHEHVILPGFGEFSTKYIPARFIPEEKKIESPSKVISFDAEKKDGETPLIGYMAAKEFKDPEQIKKFIGDFVSEINETLTSGQKVQLERLGVFSHDADGKISFDPDRSINYLSGSAGLGTISEPAKIKTPPIVAPPPVFEAPPVVETPEPEPVAEVPQPEKTEEPAKPAPEPVSLQEEKPVTPIESLSEVQEPVKQDLPVAIKWLAWVIIPLLAIIIILAFNWSFIFGKRSKAPAPRPQTETVAPAPAVGQADEAPASATESPAATEAVPATTPAPATATTAAVPEAGRKVYYIVVGAFQDEGQANRYVEELKGKGANQAGIFMKTGTGFHRVAYAFYYDLAEAEAQLSRVQQNVNSNAWILQR